MNEWEVNLIRKIGIGIKIQANRALLLEGEETKEIGKAIHEVLMGVSDLLELKKELEK